MASTKDTSLAAAVITRATTSLGRPGRFVVASSMAGGILLGGFLVAAATFFDELAVAVAPEVTEIAFVAGAILGFVHGSVFGYLGRPDEMLRREATASVMAGAIWLVPGTVVAYFTALWLSMTRWSFDAGQPLLITGVVLSWVIGGAVCVWFARELWNAARAAVQRWPQRRRGVAIIGFTFVVLLVFLLTNRPEIWLTEQRISVAGAAVLAFAITIWAALPLEVLLLHVVRRRA